jgi:TRAP-type C4-dicarboxylate transport system permease small subunit
VRGLLRAYAWLTTALAVVAGLVMSAIFVAVVADVTLRDLGFQSPRATVPLSEFGLLYITMLGSPWLLRTKGHIVVESLRLVLPARVRRPLELAVYAICAGACGVLAWFALEQTVFTWVNNQAEQRAIDMPLYYAYGPMFLGFFLMGIEFLRLLFGRETLYEQSGTTRETI